MPPTRPGAEGTGSTPYRTEIGAALSALFSSVGLCRRGNGTDAAIAGIDWKEDVPPAPQLRIVSGGKPARRLGPLAKRSAEA